MNEIIITDAMNTIDIIYPMLLYVGLLIFFGLVIISLFYNKNLIRFLNGIFTIAFWSVLAFFLFQISMELFTDNGSFKASENGRMHSKGHYSKGYNVPVKIDLYISPPKEELNYKKDSTNQSTSSITFSRFINPNDNFFKDNIPGNFNKQRLEAAGLTEKKLDSFFKNSSGIKITGNKLQIGFSFEKNQFLKTSTSSFTTEGYLNIKSSNWFFTLCQLIRSYIPFIITLLILYQLKSIFKLLKKEFNFSLELSKKIKFIGFLLVIGQLLTLTLSVIFSFYFKYAGFENTSQNNGIRLNINPSIEFDITLILVGLSLLLLSILLNKGHHIQQENDLTI